MNVDDKPDMGSRIHQVMQGDESSLLGMFLYPLSKIYGCAVRVRTGLYANNVLKKRTLPCTVISIGNITAGGTGKTPMAVKTADFIRDLGYKAALLSRGYKGDAEKCGGIVSDRNGILMGPETAGDEPVMMAEKLDDVPVLVGADRYASGMLAMDRFKPDVIILDDGFQHIRLHRDINLLLLDCKKPFGNGHMLPRGCLREPISALSRADAVVLTRSETVSDIQREERVNQIREMLPGKSIFTTIHSPFISTPSSGDLEDLNGRSVYGFSGLADNDGFKETLKQLGCSLTGFRGFPDHYKYTKGDLKEIISFAEEAGADCIVTTEKDHVKAGKLISWPMGIVVVGIDISFGDEEISFKAFLEDRLNRICKVPKVPKMR